MALKGKKVLVTGPAGRIAEDICRRIAPDNEVWGIARFTAPGSRQRVEGLGVRTVAVDLEAPDFTGLPDDFDHVLHLAGSMGDTHDFDRAIKVTGIGTGHLLSRFRDAGSVLVMSTSGVYQPHEDPFHRYKETDPLGSPYSPSSPTYAIANITEEAIARYAAEAYGVNVVITRMNVAYSPRSGVPLSHLKAILNDEPIHLRWDPVPYSPIHEKDIAHHLEGLLAAASAPATIVNFGGDDVVTAQEWCALFGELAQKEPKIEVTPIAGSQRGVATDPAKRLPLTGPATTPWREGIRQVFEEHMAGL